jgi:hypothetical protein
VARIRILVLFCMLFGVAAAHAVELEVPPHRQELTAWTWATAIAIVVEYSTGSAIEDCEVRSAYERLLGEPGACCGDPLSCLRPGVAQEIAFVLESIYGIAARHQPRAMALAEIAGEIDSGRLVIATLRTAASERTVVITGYENSGDVTLMDPTLGKVRVSYKALRDSPAFGTWSATVVLTGAAKTQRPPMSKVVPRPTHSVASPLPTVSPGVSPAAPTPSTVLSKMPGGTLARRLPVIGLEIMRPPASVPAPWLLLPSALPHCVIC